MIHCTDIGKINEQINALYDVTTTTGKELIDTFANLITNINSNWRGSDAALNINLLISVYNNVTDFISTFQKLIVLANNGEGGVRHLETDTNDFGGSCAINPELAETLNGVKTEFQKPSETAEVYTDPKLFTYITEFANVPTTFSTFMSNLETAKDTLASNWTDGGCREALMTKFTEFKEAYTATYEPDVKKVKERLDEIASRKQSYSSTTA